MILRRRIDRQYHPWFAWHWVKLNGPVEWDRMKRTGERARWVWLRPLLRMRNGYSTYYMLPYHEEDAP